MKTLNEVLARLRNEAQGITATYGAAFERLVRNILLRAPVYRGFFKQVWLWPELGQGHDTGIDLVAVDAEGRLYGIQAKCYDEGTQVSKADIDTFLSRLGQTVRIEGVERHFDFGYVFSSTDSWTAHAEASLSGQLIPCQRITRAEMEQWEVDWAVLAGWVEGDVAPTKALRDYQLEALTAAAKHYATHDRGKLIMACGTGKTLTSLRLLEQETGGKGLALFLVPSIALLNQTLVAWSADARRPFHAVCVCSDPKAGHKACLQADTFGEDVTQLALPPTTQAEAIAKRIRHYREKTPEALTIVFSTYQSIAAVAAAQALLGREAYAFDFAICDEAHRTTGVIDVGKAIEPAFTHIHYNDHVLARRRLYMTATPRLYTAASKANAAKQSLELCSMDDETLYGEEIYRINFATAVEKGCLADYKVFVLTLPEAAINVDDLYDRLSPDDRKTLEGKDGEGRLTAIQLIGCVNALAKRLRDSPILDARDRVPARRAIAFCRTIALSKATTALFNLLAEDPTLRSPLRVEARHVDGGMNTAERNGRLAWLRAETAPNTCHLLTNVRCLSEGVDVPALDAALFLAKRNSQIDVVQSVGRVMRIAPGKRYGYIVIPVVIPEGKSPEDELENSETYGVVWSVLNALRSHDERFEAEINQLRFKRATNEAQPETAEDEDSARIRISTGLDTAPLSPDEAFPTQGTLDLRIPENMERYRQLLYGRVVEKCGNTDYFERWAADVAAIAQRHIDDLKARVAETPAAQDAFRRYLTLLQTAVYTTITEEEAYTLLAQQRITGPVFDALFGDSHFTHENPVSDALNQAGGLLVALEIDEDKRKLARFYEGVRTKVHGLTSADAKLEVIRTLYDTFFARAFSTTAQKLGIVFTPIEAVDFILRSADGALRKHFGQGLTDKGVHILDPFTGTGTFIARLLQRDLGLIRKEDLLRKYTQELHANEIVLLSYYIAAINIENVFHDRLGRKEKYTSFPGIVFGDTFRMREVTQQDTLDDEVFTPNSQRLLAQNNAPISVILGNPPYSIGQKSANDNAQNENYPALNARIEETYVALSVAANNKSLYDAYIEAFRWSSDRLDPRHGGVLCYISNGGWLDSNAGAGFRKSLQAEFDDIYVFNLRGNQLTQGETSRREGGKLFDSGCRCPITILLLVRLPEDRHHGHATIHYKDIGDYKSREDKLHDLIMYRSFFSEEWLATSQILTPNAQGDWINQRNDAFSAFISLEPKKKFEEGQSFFTTQALGVATNRDAWVYSLSRNDLAQKMRKTIAHYNETLGLPPSLDPSLISWSTNLTKAHQARKYQTFDETKVRMSAYRPFYTSWQYFDGLWNERRGISPKLFPTGKRGENVVICVSGVGVQKEFSCIITDITPDLELIGKSQCFPLYWYSESPDQDLFRETQYTRHDGVSDWVLGEARRRYAGENVTKEDLFYYVYGFLHQPTYRATFAADLKKSLPRIPLVEGVGDFRQTVAVGRALANLHLHYDTCAPYPLTEVGTGAQPTFEKPTFPKKDVTRVVINPTLMLEGIPKEAHDYVVNGRSPIAWALDRYRVTTHKESGLVNDPNRADPELLPGVEASPARALATLIKRLTTLSLESLRLIAQLPPWHP